jgi:hypothetical protein
MPNQDVVTASDQLVEAGATSHRMRITTAGRMRNYIQYALTHLQACIPSVLLYVCSVCLFCVRMCM